MNTHWAKLSMKGTKMNNHVNAVEKPFPSCGIDKVFILKWTHEQNQWKGQMEKQWHQNEHVMSRTMHETDNQQSPQQNEGAKLSMNGTKMNTWAE